jgi:predicted dinucleotide-binding enzyme
VYGARDPQAEDVRNLVAKSGPNASATTVTAAAASCSAILLAIPWSVTHDVLSAIGPVAGKTLIDCINPIRSDFSGLDLDVSTAPSAAEQIAGWAPGAKVVKAFNTVSDAAMVNPKFGDQKATMFYCGDDKEAKALVRQLTEDADLEPVDAGPLKNASYLEALAMLYIHLAIFGGWGADCAFKLVRR